MKTISTYPKKKLARSLGYDPKMYIGQSRSCYKGIGRALDVDKNH